MRFKKPNGLRYTDLCIYIDENAYKDTCDNDKLYEFLWVLIAMLSHKKCFFKRNRDYEDFCLFATNRMYLRYKNPKQFEIDEFGNPKLDKIKNVLDYLKGSLSRIKSKYDHQFDKHMVDLSNDANSMDSIGVLSIIEKTIDQTKRLDFNLYLEDIPRTIKDFVYKCPYANQPIIHNIYKSCLLSFLNLITLRNDEEEQLRCSKQRQTITPQRIQMLYEKQLNDFVILYHLESSMYSYIRVLTLRIRDIVKKDIEQIISSSPIGTEDIEAVLSETLREIIGKNG